jgi:hypothetical protein
VDRQSLQQRLPRRTRFESVRAAALTAGVGLTKSRTELAALARPAIDFALAVSRATRAMRITAEID